MSTKDDFSIDVPLNLIIEYEEIEDKLNKVFDKAMKESADSILEISDRLEEKMYELSQIKFDEIIKNFNPDKIEMNFDKELFLSELESLIDFGGKMDLIQYLEEMKDILEIIAPNVEGINEKIIELNKLFTEAKDKIISNQRDIKQKEATYYGGDTYHRYDFDMDELDDHVDEIQKVLSEIINQLSDINDTVNSIFNKNIMMHGEMKYIIDELERIKEILSDNDGFTDEGYNLIMEQSTTPTFPVKKVDIGRMSDDIEMLLNEVKSQVKESKISNRETAHLESEIDQITNLAKDLKKNTLLNMSEATQNIFSVNTMYEIENNINEKLDEVYTQLYDYLHDQTDIICDKIQNITKMDEDLFDNIMEVSDEVESIESGKNLTHGNFLSKILYDAMMDLREREENTDNIITDDTDRELYEAMRGIVDGMDEIKDMIRDQRSDNDIDRIRDSKIEDGINQLIEKINQLRTSLRL